MKKLNLYAFVFITCASCSCFADEDYSQYYRSAESVSGVNGNLIRSIAIKESDEHPYALNYGGVVSFYPSTRKAAEKILKTVSAKPWFVRSSAREKKPLPRLFRTRSRAIAAQRHYRRSSVVRLNPGNVDVGMMQINWRWHKSKIRSVKSLLDPAFNVTYAARYLRKLIDENGYVKGVGYYHHRAKKAVWGAYAMAVLGIYKDVVQEEDATAPKVVAYAD